MLELLLLRVLHDGLGLAILLEADPLLVPADRFSFLGERHNHPRERSGLLRKLTRRLVILLESHRSPPWCASPEATAHAQETPHSNQVPRNRLMRVSRMPLRSNITPFGNNRGMA